MPTIVTHALIPATIRAAMRPAWLEGRLALAGGLLAMAPDVDVLGFRWGIHYGDPWGHRGATHSLAFAAMAVAALALVWPRARSWAAAGYLWVAMISHGALDTLTNGGKGVALLWPFATDRFFAVWRPIRVSPIGARFLSGQGLETILSEVQWIWLPSLAIVLLARLIRTQD